MSIIYEIRKLLTIYRTFHPGRMIPEEAQRKRIALATLHLDVGLAVRFCFLRGHAHTHSPWGTGKNPASLILHLLRCGRKLGILKNRKHPESKPWVLVLLLHFLVPWTGHTFWCVEQGYSTSP